MCPCISLSLYVHMRRMQVWAARAHLPRPSTEGNLNALGSRRVPLKPACCDDAQDTKKSTIACRVSAPDIVNAAKAFSQSRQTHRIHVLKHEGDNSGPDTCATYLYQPTVVKRESFGCVLFEDPGCTRFQESRPFCSSDYPWPLRTLFPRMPAWQPLRTR